MLEQSPAAPVAPVRVLGGHVNGTSTPTVAEMIAFGGIQDAATSGVRSSARLHAQPGGDATQLERAARRTRDRNENFNSGTNLLSKFSFVELPDFEIMERASRIGVSLGSTISSVSESINLLKDVEMERALTLLHKNVGTANGDVDGLHNIFVSKISDLYVDLDDESVVIEDDQSDRCVRVTRPRKKKVYDCSAVRRSSRIKKQRRYSW